MKIKHFMGYGSINAKVVEKKTDTSTHEMGYWKRQAKVQVWGNHEYGLDRSQYKEDVVKWLAKVIKAPFLNEALSYTGPQSYNFWSNVNVEFNYIKDIENQEAGEYTISWRERW